MAFTPAPTPPNSGDPANFNPRADAFLGWMAAFQAELNATAYPNLPVLARIRGSAALPIWSFEGDPDTGMWSPAANILAWSTGGVERLRLSAAGLLTSPTAITQGATDTTAGRLLTPGFMGLGGSAIILTAADDLNTMRETGFYGVWSGGDLPANAPPSVTHGSILMQRQSSTIATQMVISAAGATAHQVFVRSRNGASWGPWRRLIGLDDIEGGRNANGRYLKFPDGTMLCSFRMAASDTEAAIWTFPAPFFSIEDLAVQITPLVNSSPTQLTGAGIEIFQTNTQVGINVTRSGGRVALAFNAHAMGKWK